MSESTTPKRWLIGHNGGDFIRPQLPGGPDAIAGVEVVEASAYDDAREQVAFQAERANTWQERHAEAVKQGLEAAARLKAERDAAVLRAEEAEARYLGASAACDALNRELDQWPPRVRVLTDALERARHGVASINGDGNEDIHNLGLLDQLITSALAESPLPGDDGKAPEGCRRDSTGADWFRCPRGTVGCPIMHDGAEPACIACTDGLPCKFSGHPDHQPKAPSNVAEARAAGWEVEHDVNCPACGHGFTFSTFSPPLPRPGIPGDGLEAFARRDLNQAPEAYKALGHPVPGDEEAAAVADALAKATAAKHRLRIEWDGDEFPAVRLICPPDGVGCVPPVCEHGAENGSCEFGCAPSKEPCWVATWEGADVHDIEGSVEVEVNITADDNESAPKFTIAAPAVPATGSGREDGEHA